MNIVAFVSGGWQIKERIVLFARCKQPYQREVSASEYFLIPLLRVYRCEVRYAAFANKYHASARSTSKPQANESRSI